MRDLDEATITLTEGNEGGDDNITIEQLKELSGEAPVVRLANMIISRGITDKASDIHIEPAKDGLRIRYRVDGILSDGMTLPKKAQASITSRIKIMADMDISEKRAPQDGRISATIEGRPYDFRVSTLPAVFGEKIVMRVLDKSNISVGLHKLGLLPYTFEMFEIHDPAHLRDHSGHRADRIRQVHDAVLRPRQTELRREEHSDHRRPGGV